MFVLIKGNGPAVYLAVYLAAGSNKQLSILPYYCQPRWRLRPYQQISNPALLSRIYMFRNIGFWTPKPIKLANMHFETNKLRMVMSCNCNGSHRSIGKCYITLCITGHIFTGRLLQADFRVSRAQWTVFLKSTKDSLPCLIYRKKRHVRLPILAFACPTVFGTAGALVITTV